MRFVDCCMFIHPADFAVFAIWVSCVCPNTLAESLMCFVGLVVPSLGVVMHPELCLIAFSHFIRISAFCIAMRCCKWCLSASSVNFALVAIGMSCEHPDMLAESFICFVDVVVPSLGVAMHPESCLFSF